MIKDANPYDKGECSDLLAKQTVELRSPDGSADIHMLFAGLVVAIGHGLEMNNALETSEKLHVNYNIFSEKRKSKEKNLESLPASCWESAGNLLEQRQYFEKDGIFPAGVIDNVAEKLKAFNDKELRERLFNKNDEI